MSTAITPIVDQLELDRDRFKILINGTVTDTVQLETRVEKSIAGQVQARIDELAIDLNQAVTDAEAARDAAVVAKNETITLRDQTQTLHDDTAQLKTDVTGLKAETTTLRNEALDFRNQAEEFANSIGDAIGEPVASRLKLTQSYPSTITPATYFYPAENFHLIGQSFDTNGHNLNWVSRRFELIQMDAGFDPAVDTVDETTPNYTVILDTTVTEDSVYNPVATPDNTATYAWRFTDSVANPDELVTGAFPSAPVDSITEWTFFQLDTLLPHISQPTVSSSISTTASVLDPTFTISGAVRNNTVDVISHTRFRVYDADGYVIYDVEESGEQTSHQIPMGVLETARTYKFKAQYVIAPATADDMPVLSPWSEMFTFTTESVQSFIPRYETKSVETTASIDVKAATVFRVDGTTSPTLTLSNATLGTDRAMVISVFVTGSGGTITWPAEINWSGGTEPTLGTNWTNVVLSWTGTMWIGSEGAKN